MCEEESSSLTSIIKYFNILNVKGKACKVAQRFIFARHLGTRLGTCTLQLVCVVWRPQNSIKGRAHRELKVLSENKNAERKGISQQQNWELY